MTHKLKSKSRAERFWSKVDQSGGPEACWLWQVGTNNKGYGTFHEPPEHSGVKNKSSQAHRVGWELANGPIPQGMCVLHRCDTPRCVNAAHLFLGTQQENIADMFAKKREARGTDYGHTTLTNEKVQLIRAFYAKGLNQYEIASAFNVSQVTISNILTGKAWKHVC